MGLSMDEQDWQRLEGMNGLSLRDTVQSKYLWNWEKSLRIQETDFLFDEKSGNWEGIICISWWYGTGGHKIV